MEDKTRSGTHSQMAAFRAALPATLPVMTGYLCLGLAYGLLMTAQGFSPVWPILMSLVVYGGSIQYAAIGLMVSVFDPVQAFLLSVMVNARHVFYGLSMLKRYQGTGRRKALLVAALTDETFSLVSTLEPPEGADRTDFYFWISLLDYGYWAGGTALGALLGSVLTVDTTGMDFALTALFVVLFLEQWKKKENRPAGAIGLGCAAASLLVFGADNMVIPAMVLIMAVLLGGRKKLCA